MQKPLPPLNALVAFEASVRFASFKLAAQELHITAGAVSQQVKKLEDWLGYALFERQTRQLVVTDKGLAYFSQIAPALEQIGAASQKHKLNASNCVYLSLTQTLAAKWLSPRLSTFMTQHPDIEVHINASNKPVDFQNDNADLALRHFDGKDKKLNVQLILNDEIRLFCAPEYLKRHQLKHPNDLTKTSLIVNTLHPCWDEWLDHFSEISLSERQAIPKIHFDQTLLAIDAAKHGQGVVISNRALVQKELEQGELIEPFGYKLTNNKNFYLVHPKQTKLSPAAKLLKAWLLDEFKQSRHI
jgi:LysR family glycine cleavage system transcriptional activator